MKKPLSLLLAALMLLSLGVGAFADEGAPADGEIDYLSGTPWMCSELEGNVTADTPTNLKDDFYLAVNKEALLSLEIPEGYSNIGTLFGLRVQSDEEVKDLFLGDPPEDHDAKLAYDLFWLKMDWDSRNALGVEPLKKMTDRIEAISSIDELTAYYLETPPEEVPACIWTSGITKNLDDTSQYRLCVADAGLLLEDSAEYSELTAIGKIKKDAYTEYATKLLLKLGYTEEEAAQKIENCFSFESQVAGSIPTWEEQMNPDFYDKLNNVITREELEQAQGKLPLLAFLEQAQGFPEAEEYYLFVPEYIEKLNELYTDENVPMLRDALIVYAALAYGEDLDRECYDWSVACDSTIRGANGTMDDETAFSIDVSETLEWAMARLYAERYLKAEDKARISDLVDSIIEEYHGILSEAEFLSDATRAKAIEKLDAINKAILYPDDWSKYSYEGLDFASREDGGTYWDALTAISRYWYEDALKEYAKGVDKTLWAVTPQTVNCVYDMMTNTMYILGAFARGNVYNSDMSDAELYGSLGVVIGHEISHAFDANGGQFDKDGNLVDWWTEEDRAAFDALDQRLADYLNTMHPWEGQDFHGEIMTGESSGDMAGLKVMLRLARENPDFDYDLFFRSVAVIWLTKDSLNAAYQRISDEHPMPYLRVNTDLQQFDEFFETYGITEGDGMYLAPADRVAIW